MTDRFEKRLKVVMKYEGGYSNDRNDHGGETKYGISKRAFPQLDIATLTETDAAVIYRVHYWARCRCDELPAGIDLLIFDIACNQGVRRAARCLQRALNVPDDGVIGPVTLGAVRAFTGHLALCREITARRCKMYATTPNVERFGLGWYRRAIDALGIAESLVGS